jgi:hypothetical protein
VRWPHKWGFKSGPAALSGHISKAPGFAGGYLLLIGTLFWTIARDTRYYNSWPTSPQPEIGRTIPRAVRRSVTVYISPQDAQFDYMLEGILLYSGLVGAIFVFLSGELTRSIKQNREQQ